MNRLTIPNGGMPFEGDDLIYLQQQLRDGFKYLLQAFSPYSINFILKGVELSENSGTTTVSPGLVVIDYEILEFPGASIPTANLDTKAIALDVTFDPSGNEVFADQVSKDTYEVRKAKIVDASNVPNELAFNDTQSFERLGRKVGQLTDLFKSYTLPLPDGFSGQLIAYKFGKMITLSGDIVSSYGYFDGEFISNINTDLRPLFGASVCIPIRGHSDPNSGDKYGILSVATYGTIFIYHSNANAAFSVTYLSQ